MYQRMPKTILLIQLLLAVFLTNCDRPPSPPMLVSWAEQYAAAEGIVKDLGSEFVLVQAGAIPVRRYPDPGTSDEPIELDVYLHFENPKSSGTFQGHPGYASTLVRYNDHQLAATLSADDVALRAYISVPALERVSMIQISPQDALQLTLTEGEIYMGRPVDRGNIHIDLVWDVTKDHPELENALAPAWQIKYYRNNSRLHILVDAQSGEILKRYEVGH